MTHEVYGGVNILSQILWYIRYKTNDPDI